MSRNHFLSALRTLRYLGAVSMLGVVLAGAFGYGPEAQLAGASVGFVAAVLLKGFHVIG